MPDCGVHYLWFAFVCFLIRSHPPKTQPPPPFLVALLPPPLRPSPPPFLAAPPPPQTQPPPFLGSPPPPPPRPSPRPSPPPPPESGPRVGGSRRMARCYSPPVGFQTIRFGGSGGTNHSAQADEAAPNRRYPRGGEGVQKPADPTPPVWKRGRWRWCTASACGGASSDGGTRGDRLTLG